MSERDRKNPPRLPRGVVTLLLADLEGSTPLWERSAEAMHAAVGELGELLREACARFDGVKPPDQGEGDSFLLAFERASDALACAWSLRGTFAGRDWPGGHELAFRMALHTGEVELRPDGNYAGAALARCARVRDLGRGGQLLLTSAARALLLDALPPGTRLRERGSHDLRGLTRPELVFELAGEGEDERALRGASDPRGELPAERTSLIGRDPDCAAIESTLEQSALLTLVGSGGSGKTRLALHVAHRSVERYTDGACWIDAAELRDPSLVLRAVASAAGVADSARDGVGGVARALARKHMLIVLDNCEHLIEACAELAEAFVAQTPRVRLLATSREPLRVAGEHTFPLQPLALPDDAADVESVAGADAVRLLVERAAQVRPDLRVTEANAQALAGICRRLDGLPLAIELAAARLRVLSPEQVLGGLSDRFRLLTGGARSALARQRTLEASVEWSWELLDEAERTVLRRLAIFPGSFDLRAAESVCADASVDAYEVLDLLTRLVDRSLVQAELEESAARYRLLETIRAYAASRLAEKSDGSSIRGRHLDHFAARSADLAPALASKDPRAARDALGLELANLRAALDWAVESGRADRGLEMMAATNLFWIMRGLESEATARLEQLLDARGLDDFARARGNAAAADFAIMAFDLQAAPRFAARAVELARALNDAPMLCEALILWAYSAHAGADELRAAVNEALAIADTLDDPLPVWRADMMGGFVLARTDSPPVGLARLERARDRAREIGAPPLITVSESLLAIVCGVDGRLAEARAAAERALDAAGDLLTGTWFLMADISLAWADFRSGALDAAARRLEHTQEAFLAAGRSQPAYLHLAAAELAFRRGEFERSRTCVESIPAEALGMSGHAGMVLVWLDLAAGDPVAAQARLEILDSGVGLERGEIELLQAYVARAEADLDAAWEHAHDALAGSPGRWVPAALCLEALAGLAASRNRAELGARLLGAADRVVEESGYARNPVEAAEHAWGVETLRSTLDAETFERAFAEGCALELADAVELAKRGRGRRRRPTFGFESLTPTELEVARLVRDGHSNPAIATKLLVSVNTVKSHLSHAYGKLGVSSRAELAAEVARHGAERPEAGHPTGRNP